MSATNPRVSKGGLFRAADGTSLALTFVLITSLFLLWGFCNGMIDILNKHFQDTLRINKEQSGLVQAANYLGYFLMAIPAGLIAKRFGYKGGILAGLSLIAAGAFWFIPAVQHRHVLGVSAGIVCHRRGHDVPGNDCESVCDGSRRARIWAHPHQHRPDRQRSRLDTWPDCWGPLCFFRRRSSECQCGADHTLSGYRHLCGFAAHHLRLSRVPDLHIEDEDRRFAERQDGVKPSGTQQAGIAVIVAAVCGLLYFFIAPILTLMWRLLHMSEKLCFNHQNTPF